MSVVKLTADSGGGAVSLKAPSSTTSNADVQLTLPVDDGTSSQYLQTNGSGVLSWATVNTTIADDSIVEAKLDVSNAPTNGQFLQAQSGEGGGLTWAAVSSPAMVKLNTFETTAGDNAQACNVDGHFTADYHTYLYVAHVSPDDANSDFSWRVMRSGSVVTASEYSGHAFRGYNDTSDNNQVGTGEPSAGDYNAPDDGVFPHADDMVDGDLTKTSTLELWLYNPLSTSEWKRFKSTFMFQAAYNMNTHYQNGQVQNTAALSGVSLYMNNGSTDIVCKGALYGLTI